ncbi:MAG: hypothetical protein AAGE94_06390 [Acidobacteriota bacterium]
MRMGPTAAIESLEPYEAFVGEPPASVQTTHVGLTRHLAGS